MKSGYHIYQDPSKEELALIQQRVEDYKTEQTGGEYNLPGIEINLVLRNPDGKVVGGVIASTEFRVMHLEVLWVADEYRRMGYGGRLVLAAEQIALQSGCRAGQTWTFAFQGPGFYPTIGYTEFGVYRGYPNGLTEHVFGKPLTPAPAEALGVPDSKGVYLAGDASEEEIESLHKGLMEHSYQNIDHGIDGFSIKLGAKDTAGELVGGLFAWTTLDNVIFEYIWVDEAHRNKGLGTHLMQEMELIAREKGCIASQVYSFSFQAPAFFQKMGYQVLGVSEGFPPPARQYYFIKKYN